MKCFKCGKETKFKQPINVPGAGLMVVMRSHAEAEKWAWYCANCDKVFCGECCLPEWQALKAKEGLSGPKLAAKLDRDPNAFFGEQAACPTCKMKVVDEMPNFLNRLKNKFQKRRSTNK